MGGKLVEAPAARGALGRRAAKVWAVEAEVRPAKTGRLVG